MLIAVVGATGTGKSELSLDLAEGLAAAGRPAEIVNADAMQFYRGMNIGTAKLTLDQRRGVPHHMLDTLDVAQEASVAAYQVEARAAIAEIQGRGAVAILVGGSGLYISSVLFDFRFPGRDTVVRERLEAELLAQGSAELHRRLQGLDAVAAAAIGARNGRRLVRALEVIEITGRPFGSGLPDESRLWRPASIIGLRAPRAQLVERLDARVRRMWSAGLLDEVRAIGADHMGVTARRAIGYAQAIAQLAGELSEEAAIEQTAALTRRYARRQVSWFGRYPDVDWLEHDDPGRVGAGLASIAS